MTTPPCPRCNAPLNIGSDRVWCDAYGCAYGHDAPRTLVPQPDLVGVAALSKASRTAILRALDASVTEIENYGEDPSQDELELASIERARLEIEAAHPAPTPADNAKSAGVDEGMRERVAAAIDNKIRDHYGRGGRLCLPPYGAQLIDVAITAILASHEIVRR